MQYDESDSETCNLKGCGGDRAFLLGWAGTVIDGGMHAMKSPFEVSVVEWKLGSSSDSCVVLISTGPSVMLDER